MLGNPLMDGGGVELHLCGQPRRLRFDWGHFGALRAKHGPDFQSRLNEAMLTLDLDVIAETLALALGLSPDAIKRDAPPIVPTVEAMHRAFNLAYHGPDGPPKASKRPFVARARETLRSILSWMQSRLG